MACQTGGLPVVCVNCGKCVGVCLYLKRDKVKVAMVDGVIWQLCAEQSCIDKEDELVEQGEFEHVLYT